MKTIWKLSELRLRYIFILLVGLYILNYFVTEEIVGPVRLEAYYRPHFSQKFDSKLWKESGLIDDGKHGKDSPSYGKRYEMLDDVLASCVPVGMDEERVRAILGSPDGGIIDKKSIIASPDPYGGNKLNPDKEILASPDSIAWWAYHLAYQRQYPAKPIWFPRTFSNSDRWMFVIKMRNGKVSSLQVSF